MEQELIEASKEGDLKRVKELLSEGVDPNIRDRYMCTPLY